MANVITIIEPYWFHDTWVFDDPSVGLDKEPFVSGIPEMIDELVRDIPGARGGFRLLFSSVSFPGHQLAVRRVREDSGGNWYRIDGRTGEGWLCPALLRYFETAPEIIYVSAQQSVRKPGYDANEIEALRSRVEELEKAIYALTLENELLKTDEGPSSSVEQLGPQSGRYWDSGAF